MLVTASFIPSNVSCGQKARELMATTVSVLPGDLTRDPWQLSESQRCQTPEEARQACEAGGGERPWEFLWRNWD